jgi:hypothetical protein
MTMKFEVRKKAEEWMEDYNYESHIKPWAMCIQKIMIHSHKTKNLNEFYTFEWYEN